MHTQLAIFKEFLVATTINLHNFIEFSHGQSHSKLTKQKRSAGAVFKNGNAPFHPSGKAKYYITVPALA